MVEPKPVKIPIWNTSGSNRTEPPSGNKTSGWALSEEPPSSWFNWLQHYTGAWFVWLDERLIEGTRENDFTVNALVPDATGAGGTLKLEASDANTTGAGGAAILRAGSAVGSGAGGTVTVSSGNGLGSAGGNIALTAGSSDTAFGGQVIINAGASQLAGGPVDITGGSILSGSNQPGGDVLVKTGSGRGTGSASIEMKVSEGGASGSTLNSPADYLVMDGANGVKTVAPKRYLDLSDNDASRGVMKLASQAQPTSPVAGDIYYDSVTDHLRFHDQNGHKSLTPLFDPVFRASNQTNDTVIKQAFNDPFSGIKYTIPANYLSIGSIIRGRFNMSRLNTPADEPGLEIRIGPVGSWVAPPGVPGGTIAAAANPKTGSSILDSFMCDFEIYIDSVSSGEARAFFFARPGGTPSWDNPQCSFSTASISVDTTVANEVFPVVYWFAVGTGLQYAVTSYFSMDVI